MTQGDLEMRELHQYSDETLLQELVQRGRIHPSRLRKHHLITFHDRSGDYWSMSHPLSCDLANCEFDQAANELISDPEALIVPGTFEWPKPTWRALRLHKETP